MFGWINRKDKKHSQVKGEFTDSIPFPEPAFTWTSLTDLERQHERMARKMSRRDSIGMDLVTRGIKTTELIVVLKAGLDNTPDIPIETKKKIGRWCNAEIEEMQKTLEFRRSCRERDRDKETELARLLKKVNK